MRSIVHCTTKHIINRGIVDYMEVACSYLYVCVLFSQSCLTLCNPMNYSLSGSSVYGILQARILE